MNEILLYIGSAIIILWGIAHLIPTRAIVDGFGDISEENKKIIRVGACLIKILLLSVYVSLLY